MHLDLNKSLSLALTLATDLKTPASTCYHFLYGCEPLISQIIEIPILYYQSFLPHSFGYLPKSLLKGE